MKKPILGFLLVMLASGIFAQITDPDSCIIRELTGTVELKKPGTSVFIQANTGDIVSRDTIISTGFRSTALIEAGSAVISVRPLTRLSLTEITTSGSTETINVNLQAGRVRVDVNPPAGTRASMTIQSPVATASVRGTSFEFDTRNIYVYSGAVAFSGNRGQSRTVNGGSESRAEADGSTTNPAGTDRLRPPAPVGTDSAGGSRSETSQSGGVITIRLNYSDDH